MRKSAGLRLIFEINRSIPAVYRGAERVVTEYKLKQQFAVTIDATCCSTLPVEHR